MSRVRNTLDTVSKAVSGTHTELLSKIARLKPNVLKRKKNGDAHFKSNPKVEERIAASNAVPAPTSTPAKTSAATPSLPSPGAMFDASTTTITHPHNSTQEATTSSDVIVHEHKDKELSTVVPAVKATCAKNEEECKSSHTDPKNKSLASLPPTELFHPSTFSANLDETYNYVASHINSYFGTSSTTQVKKVDNLDTFSASTPGQQSSDLVSVSGKSGSGATDNSLPSKKGLGHYLSYSAPTVQAFVGNYIAPLVPKFRTGESKSAAAEEQKPEDVSVKQGEATISKEQKAAEDKAKKLLLQREKVCP